MASLGPWLGRRREPWVGSDVWDLFGLGSGYGGTERRDDPIAVTNASPRKLVKLTTSTSSALIFLAGVRKEEVKVQVEDRNVLQISGGRAEEQEEKGDGWRRVERWRCSFARWFGLPEKAELNGVPTIMVPKKGTGQETPRNVRYIDWLE